MLQKLFSARQLPLTKWSFLVHRTTHYAPYIHLRHDSILALWWNFPNDSKRDVRRHVVFFSESGEAGVVYRRKDTYPV